MRKLSILIITVMAVILASSAFAADEVSIAMINMEKIAAECEEFTDALKDAEAEIRTAQSEDQAKLDEYTSKIQELEAKLSGPLTDAAKQTTYEEYVAVANEAMAYQENSYARYEQMQVMALQNVYKNVYAKIQDIAKSEDYDAVYDSVIFAYVDETKVVDISDQCIEELNAEYMVVGGGGE